MQRYQNPTEGSWEIFKKPTSAALFSDYQTFANNTPGWEQYCFRRQPYYLFLPSLQAMCLLKIRVARTLDQFQGPNVLRNQVFRSFSSFCNFSVAWTRPCCTKISVHRISWTGRNQATCISFILMERYQNLQVGSWEILKKPTSPLLFSD